MSYRYISKDRVLVSYIPKLDYDIVNSHNLDFIKIVNKYTDNEVENLNVT